MPMNAEVIFNIANIHDLMGNMRQATKWFNILTTRVPTDPGILSRLGQIYSRDDDEAQAFHYHLESYRYYPVSTRSPASFSMGKRGQVTVYQSK